MTRANSFGLYVNPFALSREAPTSLQRALATASRALGMAEHVCVLVSAADSLESRAATDVSTALKLLGAYVPHSTLITQHVDDLLQSSLAATLACDVFLSIGTSNTGEPAASLPWIAASHGATVIVVNRSMESQRSGPSIVQLQGLPCALLPQMMSSAFAGRKPRYNQA